MAELNDTEVARVTLQEAWRQLAPYIDRARRLQEQATRDPSKQADRWVQTNARWLSVFNRQLAAIQTVYEATEAGKRVPVDELRSASEAADKLLAIISDLQQRVPQPA
jgi:hypothetical protein